MAGLVPPARAEALCPDFPAIASVGEGPAIHVFSQAAAAKSWMPGTRPGMTSRYFVRLLVDGCAAASFAWSREARS
jgi:hypothetical protein